MKKLILRWLGAEELPSRLAFLESEHVRINRELNQIAPGGIDYIPFRAVKDLHDQMEELLCHLNLQIRRERIPDPMFIHDVRTIEVLRLVPRSLPPKKSLKRTKH